MSEDKVPHWTCLGERNKTSFVPFHAKSGSGLAYPCFSNVLAFKHKQLIVFLTFSAKEHVKKYTVSLINMTKVSRSTCTAKSSYLHLPVSSLNQSLRADIIARRSPTPTLSYLLINTYFFSERPSPVQYFWQLLV